MLRMFIVMGIFSVGTAIFSERSLSAQESLAKSSNANEIPALSLESLYHPELKHDFDGNVPPTHWLDDSPPKLLIRRDDMWNEVDLRSSKERPSEIVERLAEKLEKLDGVDRKKARAAAIASVTKMEASSDSLLVKLGESLAIAPAQSPARWLTKDASQWANVTLDPSSRRVAYTMDGDLFVVDAATGRSLRLTNDASDTLLDGILDWTYQEEIFGRGNYRGFWFSPSGEWLAMLRVDISGIPEYVLSSATSERGKGIVRRYPKAGDPIPHAELVIWDLRNFDQGDVPPSRQVVESTSDDERIVTGVWWHPHQLRLLFSVSDRRQTWRELRSAGEQFLSGAVAESKLIMREESPAWVEPPSTPAWMSDGSLVWHSALPTGRSRLHHISPNGKVITPISPEDFDVHDFFVSPDGKFAIVTGDAKRMTIDRHAYRIDLTREEKQGSVEKPSALVPLTMQPGWHSTSWSPDGRWITDLYSTPTQPPQLALRSTQDVLVTQKGQAETVLFSSTLQLEQNIVPPDLFQIPTPDGVLLPAMLIRPNSASNSERCPVVIEVYGGPQNPVVSSRWSETKSLYRELLARRGIATLLVDNRSSGGRISDSWAIRHRVGEVEVQDLLVAVKWLKSQPWVDSNHLAIRGWSFGGFMTLYAMARSDDFVAGIAGGSVTDWREYDAFYTERYMGLPSENERGYQTTAPASMAGELEGKVMLIHGESDDNVHPSGTLRMALELQKAGKDFRLMIYPGAAHGIRDPLQVWHMAQMTDRFLLEELGIE